MRMKLATCSALSAVAGTLVLANPWGRAAHAEPHKVLVLQSEGRADAAIRAKIDAAIVKLAKVNEPLTSAGDISYSDAAAAVGCKPEVASCKDEVLGTFAVDELVITTVTPKPGGLEVAVRRVGKGGASRDAFTVIPAGQPPQLDAIATLFGGKAVDRPVVDKPIVDKPIDKPMDKPVDRQTPKLIDKPDRPPEVIPNGINEHPAPPPVSDSGSSIRPLNEPDDHTGRRRRLEIAGMAGGGGMIVLGFILWGQASGAQSDIRHAPDKTKADLDALRSLESRADSYAAWGNVLALSGLVVGGLSGYFYWRDRGTRSSQARLGPAIFDHGAGIALTLGGTP